MSVQTVHKAMSIPDLRELSEEEFMKMRTREFGRAPVKYANRSGREVTALIGH